MVSTVKNASVVDLGTTTATIYTTPAATTSIVHAIFVSNKSVSEITVTIQVTDTSAGTTITIASAIAIPVGSTLQIDKPVNLETGDLVKAFASVAASADIFLSVLENT